MATATLPIVKQTRSIAKRNKSLEKQSRCSRRPFGSSPATRQFSGFPIAHFVCPPAMVLLVTLAITLYGTNEHNATAGETLFNAGVQTPAAAELSEAKELARKGDYEEALLACTEAIDKGIWNEEWYLLKIKLDLKTGAYSAAEKTLELGLDKYSSSIDLRWLGYQVLNLNNKPEEAQTLLESIEEIVRRYPWRFTGSTDRVLIGRYMLENGYDAKEVLSGFFDKAKDSNPSSPAAYQATAELALEKFDFALAAKELNRAVVLDETDPTLHYLLAQAYASSDSERAQQALAKALELNPRHIDSLLWTADMAIDSEKYVEAEKSLKIVERVNKRLPELWAYRAVIAHLQGDYEQEVYFVAKALAPCAHNPEIDHLVGRKLSQKYRFFEGARYQRKALDKDPTYLPAMFQLSQDLLRLGDEEEGWQLAQQVYQADGYNVVAHNLVTLNDVMSKFVTLEDQGIELRMGSREAELYGPRAMRLLVRAKEELSDRYQIKIDKPIIVEIFPEQKDFAIRTFGLPGGQGFLGVCFGRVITANSPASQGTHPSNWEATLWHEFCHVITLEKTNNRMPRWLSEGISVYEERRAGPGWGQTMNSTYRGMIVGGELVPVDDLSSAFLRPASSQHLQFAYYESSLVVEYLVEEHGLDVLLNVLVDLGIGMPINEALTRYVGDLQAFNTRFESYVRERADGLAPDADWSEPNIVQDATLDTINEWIDEHPDNLLAIRRRAEFTFERANLLQNRQESNATGPAGFGPGGAEAGGGFTSPVPGTPFGGDTAVGLGVSRTAVPEGTTSQSKEAAQLQEAWQLAATSLEELIALYDGKIDNPNDYVRLSLAYRNLGEVEKEKETLTHLVAKVADAGQAHERLLKLAVDHNDWQSVKEQAERLLAIDPLQQSPHDALAYAARQTEDFELAVEANRSILQFDTADVAATQYEMARLHIALDQIDEAKKRVLLAIQEAPRYRDAFRLYRQIESEQGKDSPAVSSPAQEAIPKKQR